MASGRTNDQDIGSQRTRTSRLEEIGTRLGAARTDARLQLAFPSSRPVDYHDRDLKSVTATPSDFLALLKPRVMSLVVFTGLVGISVAPGVKHLSTVIVALGCIAAGAGASGVLNMAFDADIDAIMERTRNRPIPRGAVGRKEAFVFGFVLAFVSVVTMSVLVNMLAGTLLAFTIGFYVGIYTCWLKRRTPQNIVIGGLAGALPPAIGWAAITGSLTLAPLVLVLIIFLWTPPHFWALALFYQADYERARIPMMPVVRGKAATRLQIFAYSLLLAPAGLLPAVIGVGGPIYVVAAVTAGALMVWRSFGVFTEHDEVGEPAAQRLFLTSLLYLFALFAALLLERVFEIGRFGAL